MTLILEGQKINQKDLRLCFIKLATQNNDLIESNKKLNDQLKTVVEELYEIKKARANQKHLPKRDPVTPEIY